MKKQPQFVLGALYNRELSLDEQSPCPAGAQRTRSRASGTAVATPRRPRAEAHRIFTTRLGYAAMRKGKPGIVTGMKNKMQVAMSGVAPDTALARIHSKQAAPGTANGHGHGHTGRLVAGALGGLALLTAARWLLADRGGLPASRRRLNARG